MIGRRYSPPLEVTAALAQAFGEPVDRIVVIENSLYARAHLGMSATTRPNRILLAGGGAAIGPIALNEKRESSRRLPLSITLAA
ncbi:MAG TPA: hypothetical protein VGI90_08155 [Steroidobacteraceae bacterium]